MSSWIQPKDTLWVFRKTYILTKEFRFVSSNSKKVIKLRKDAKVFVGLANCKPLSFFIPLLTTVHHHLMTINMSSTGVRSLSIFLLKATECCCPSATSVQVMCRTQGYQRRCECYSFLTGWKTSPQWGYENTLSASSHSLMRNIADDGVRVWSTVDYKCVQTLYSEKWGQVTALAWIQSKESILLSVGTRRGCVTLCPLSTDKQVRSCGVDPNFY